MSSSHKRHYEQFADGTVKDIEDEIPFDVPDGWAWCRLPEITEYIFAGGDKPSVFSKEKTDECFIPIYSNGIENDGLYGFTDKATAKETSLTISARGTIGFTCIRTTAFVPIIRLITITPNNDFINIHYLKAVFDSLFSFSEGSSIPQLTVPTIKQFLIPLPPFNEQKNIYSSIIKIETIIQTLEQNKNDLQISIKQTKSKILDLAIHGKLVPQDPNDEPAEELLKRIATSDNRPYKKFDDEEPFEIPNSWTWCRLKEICELKGGKRIPAGLSATKEKTNHIYIRVTDMQNNSISDADLVYITNDIFEKIQRYTINKDDLYLTIAGTIGRVGEVPEKFDGMNLTENALKLTNISICKTYLMQILNTKYVQDYFESTYHQVAMPKLSLINASKTIIPIPPFTEQQRIVSKIEELFEKLDIISKELTE